MAADISAARAPRSTRGTAAERARAVVPPTPLRPRRRSAAAAETTPLWLVAPPSSANEAFLAQLLEGLDSLSTPVVLVLVTLGEDRAPRVPGGVMAARLHLAGSDSAGSRSAGSDSADTAAGTAPRMLGTLTERERTVLHYLPSLMTYEEIASDLYVSVNTVKSHVNGIFRKLGARGRRQAVRTARDLQLL
jgi:DNA-binding CsgD family transcriptional regulator